MHAARCFVYKFSESETDSSTLMIIKQNFFNHLVTNCLKIVYFCKKSKIFVVKLARDYFAMLSFYYTTSIKKAGLLLVLENNIIEIRTLLLLLAYSFEWQRRR